MEDYRTPNTALAAYLYQQGYKLLEVDDANSQNIFFVFENTNGLLDSVRLFETARVPEALFYAAYKAMLKKIWVTKL